RKPRFDHIHAKISERQCYFELFVQIHARSRRLLTVAKRGVEDDELVGYRHRRAPLKRKSPELECPRAGFSEIFLDDRVPRTCPPIGGEEGPEESTWFGTSSRVSDSVGHQANIISVKETWKCSNCSLRLQLEIRHL